MTKEINPDRIKAAATKLFWGDEGVNRENLQQQLEIFGQSRDKISPVNRLYLRRQIAERLRGGKNIKSLMEELLVMENDGTLTQLVTEVLNVLINQAED